MTKPDWSKAPEGFPLWIESVSGNSKCCWVREEIGYYENEDGLIWGKAVEKDGRIIVHRRPDPVAWDGEGMPPVGALVKIAESTPYRKIEYPPGAEVKIYSHFVDDRGVHLAAFVDSLSKLGGVAVAECFEAIPTPEQKAARELAIDDMTMVIHAADSIEDGCATLYEFGYRKTGGES